MFFPLSLALSLLSPLLSSFYRWYSVSLGKEEAVEWGGGGGGGGYWRMVSFFFFRGLMATRTNCNSWKPDLFLKNIYMNLEEDGDSLVDACPILWVFDECSVTSTFPCICPVWPADEFMPSFVIYHVALLPVFIRRLLFPSFGAHAATNWEIALLRSSYLQSVLNNRWLVEFILARDSMQYFPRLVKTNIYPFGGRKKHQQNSSSTTKPTINSSWCLSMI